MTASKPQTIQIFLPHGDPQGMRVADITTGMIRVFEVPRNLIDKFLERDEANNVGVYYLFNESEVEGLSSCYIGQGNVGTRLSRHDKEKDFWDRALIAVSMDRRMTNTHSTYIEWRSIDLAIQAKRFQLKNANKGSKPHVTDSLEADCNIIIDTISVLLSTLGFPIFETVRTNKNSSIRTVYQCKTRRGADARGTFSDNKITVLKGSVCASTPTAKATTSGMKKERDKFLEAGIISHDKTSNKIVFTRDYTFKTPSAASRFVMFQSSNGWADWKDENKKTLDEIERAIKE